MVGFAPVLLALPGFAGRDLDFGERMLRIWPVAALLVYLALDLTWFYHVFDGLTLPLSILAVRGWRALRLPRALGLAVALAVTVPGLVWVVQQFVKTSDANFFRPGEARALAFLEANRRPGAVLAPVAPLGQAIPGSPGGTPMSGTTSGRRRWPPGPRSPRPCSTAGFRVCRRSGWSA